MTKLRGISYSTINTYRIPTTHCLIVIVVFPLFAVVNKMFLFESATKQVKKSDIMLLVFFHRLLCSSPLCLDIAAQIKLSSIPKTSGNATLP